MKEYPVVSGVTKIVIVYPIIAWGKETVDTRVPPLPTCVIRFPLNAGLSLLPATKRKGEIAAGAMQIRLGIKPLKNNEARKARGARTRQKGYGNRIRSQSRHSN